ncbi:hypothetical protein [Vibrio hepatarius]|uniref:hypothetical protein n=1 Tax=Vibrio hepatarius TaxID=171383 RepID=UPI003734DADC
MEKETYYARIERYDVSGDSLSVTFDAINTSYHKGQASNKRFNFLEVVSAQILLEINRSELPSHIKTFKQECWYEILVHVNSEEDDYIDALRFDSYQEKEPIDIKIADIHEYKKRHKKSKELTNIYQLRNIEGYSNSLATEKDILDLLSFSTLDPGIDYWLRVINVGQGSANSICLIDRECGVEPHNPQEILYLALGGGVVANSSTYPNTLTLSPAESVPVVLCHWDMDHWISGKVQAAVRETQWLVPEQKNLGISHLKFAQELSNQSRLNIWPKGLKSVKTSLIDVHKLPTSQNRNYSGLVSIVKSSKNGEKNAIYTGDAPFSRCKDFLRDYDISAVITPHHGGDMPHRAIPKAPNKHVVVSSFGNNNTFKHPFEGSKTRPISTKQRYLDKGWKNWHTTLSGDQYIYADSFSKCAQFTQLLNGIKPHLV